MNSHSISIPGKVDDKGVFKMSNRHEMTEFFKKWPGKKVIMKCEVFPEKGSELLRAYYFKKIVPDFQTIFRETDGERMTFQKTDEKLRSMCPVMLEEVPREESGGFELERVKTVYEISSSELVEYVDNLRFIASMEYEYFIDDPTTMVN